MKSTIAVMSPGDMGHAVAAVLRQGGLRVISQLDGRSAGAARRPGWRRGSCGRHRPGARSGIVLAILVPAQAIALAERIARAIAASGARPVYVDCNAIAPQTTRQIAEIIEGAGARFVDAGIMGRRPSLAPQLPGSMPRPGCRAFARLGDFGLDVRVVGDQPGQHPPSRCVTPRSPRVRRRS